MVLKRHPSPALRPFVKTLWVIDQTTEQLPALADREHVLPAGDMHLVFRLSDHPLRLFDDAFGASGHTVGRAIVGGARSTFYVRDISEPVCSAGAVLQPGAAEVLLGAPASELSGRHTRLDELWGRSASLALERLVEARHPDRRLDLLESLFVARLRRLRGLHPAVAQALERFTTTDNVHTVIGESGYSHRQFIALFRRAVGLTPKLYCRVLRFQRALERVAADPAVAWVDLAMEAGYSDQSHFNREFREFAGVTPGEYREISPSFPRHLAIRRSSR